MCWDSILGLIHNQDSSIATKEDMIIKQLKARNIYELEVLKAMSLVPRELFVPIELATYSYVDSPLPIGYGQTISQPYIVAFMTQAAQLNKSDKVLEIGTGCGYQAAILSKICKEVYSIEIIKELAYNAAERLRALNYNNAYIREGNGYVGWQEQAPFDAILMTAYVEKIPQNLIDQLKTGGRLIAPVGKGLHQELRLITKHEDVITEKILIPVRFVPMVHEK